jgi:hypothetical protein
VNHLELPEATESSLAAHIDHTQEDMQRMADIRSELNDIHEVLDTNHKDPNGTSIWARKVEELISLEGTYGSLSGYIQTSRQHCHQLPSTSNNYLSPVLGILIYSLTMINPS